MRTIFDAYTVPIVIALLIGLLIAWWMFKRGGTVAPEQTEDREAGRDQPRRAMLEEERPLYRSTDGEEGNGIADQGAAAASDVAGQMLGLQVHDQLPGADGPPDDLSLMKGVGPKLVARLNENGITRFEQIARLTDNEVGILDDRLGPFKGRLRRDRVVEQASYLARGDTDGFEAQFGKLGSLS